MRWGACLFALGAMLAGCVNDNGTTGPAQGDLGGACFKNNTCNGSLVCVLVNGTALCEAADGGGTDAAIDQSVADTSTSDASDASDAATCGVQASAACQGMNCLSSSQQCCISVNQCMANSANCQSSATNYWACGVNADCGGTTNLCCLQVNVTDGCPAQGQIIAAASCTGSCAASNQHMLCTSTSDCVLVPNTTCHATQLAGTNLTVGLCY